MNEVVGGDNGQPVMRARRSDRPRARIEPFKQRAQRAGLGRAAGQRKDAARSEDGAEPDRLPNPEPLGQQAHRGDEPFPFQVRLHSGQQQERCAHAVAQCVEVEGGILVAGEVVGLEGHHRPP